MASLAKWVTENTRIGGEPYSFVDHEYQEVIISDVSQEVVVRKCSQVGVSEATVRLALAMVNVISPMTVIYTLPTAKFAVKFMRTRVDPVIVGSPVMRTAIHTSNDNSEIKQFGESFLYLAGAASSNAPISIPADVIINDETDFSDQEILGQYNSRLTHSKWKIKRKFSTPTLPAFGIDKAFQDSRRHFKMVKCNHCNHWFIPSYYDHVRIPGFSGDLRLMTKSILARVRWQEAKLHCPSCGAVPSLQEQHREYVVENAEEKLIAAGYQVSPFDAPNIVTAADLVRVSTEYPRVQDFVNFALGLPMEDKEATLTREELLAIFVTEFSPSNTVYVMGVDVGNTYHFVVAAVDGFDDMLIVHRERVPMGKARERYFELRARFNVICTVIDSGPHAETVMGIQGVDATCYAAVYMRSRSILTHNVVDREEDKEEGEAFVRQVNVNRNRAFDSYMESLRGNHLRVLEDGNEEEKETFVSAHTSMKRVKVFDNDSGEMSYSWQKTDGEDHFHHAGLYAFIASRIRGVAKSTTGLSLFTVSKIRIRDRA